MPPKSAKPAGPFEGDFPEPIAVIGIGCHLPGNIRSTSTFWDALINGKISRSEKVPSSRFNIDAYHHTNNNRPGSFTSRGGFFLDEDLNNFDYAFFGITPVEAMWMDPQQKKLLEVVYEALEASGIALEKIAATPTGCYVGCFTNDWQQMSMREPDFRHGYAATGVDPGLLSSRVSHVFNLRGPSLTINTACSSSLYALHHACSGLRNHECDVAVVGGTNLILTVDQHINTAKLGVLSPTSQCHTFDAAADGYARADGVGAFVLKRFSDAVKSGDPIRAVIRGSYVNSNGKVVGAGITHPSLTGQEAVIRRAYQQAGNLDPLMTGYFECHGTGTAAGDPLEVLALSRAMNKDRQDHQGELLIGAVKPNIGHSEAASGIAAIAKAVLAVEKGIIPGTAGFVTPNPSINFEKLKVSVVAEPTAWPAHLPVRRASVNSFGYGGTNGHVIVEAVESTIHQSTTANAVFPLEKKYLIVVSAASAASLKGNIERNEDFLRTSKVNIRDFANTLGRRSHLKMRAYAVSSDPRFHVPPTVEPMEFTYGTVEHSSTPASSTPAVMFVFTGQGAIWKGVAVELLSQYPSFRQTLRDLDTILKGLDSPPTWTIIQALKSDSTDFNSPLIAQTLCTAIQIALVDHLAVRNVFPSVVVGHSSGEIAAAYSAGRISAAEAIRAAYYRGLVVSTNAKKGAMLAVGMGARQVESRIGNLKGSVEIACHNSPSSVTLSGDMDVIETVRTELTKDGIFHRLLKTGGCAYHTNYMLQSAQAYEVLLRDNTLPESRNRGVPMKKADWVSSVTGNIFPEEQAPSGDYWTQNLLQPVLFDTAVRTALERVRVDHIIEIGPHHTLAGPIRDILQDRATNDEIPTYNSALVRGRDGEECLLRLIGDLFLHNFDVDIQRANAWEGYVAEKHEVVLKKGNTLVDLPTYSWDYTTAAVTAENRWSMEQRRAQNPRHDILGRRIPGLAHSELQWKNFLRQQDLPWLKDHQLGEDAIFPASGYWSMAMAAVRETGYKKGDSFKIRNFDVSSALVIPENDDGVEVIFTMKIGTTENTFNVYSYIHDVWKLHASGSIATQASQANTFVAVHDLKEKTTPDTWYDRFSRVGFHYGPTFQGLKEIRGDPRFYEASATLSLHRLSGTVAGESEYALHPRSLDGCLQLGLVAIYRAQPDLFSCGYVPVSAREIVISPAAGSLEEGQAGKAIARVTQRTLRNAVVDAEIVFNGMALLQIKQLRCTTYEAVIPQALNQKPPVPVWTSRWAPDITGAFSHKEQLGILHAGTIIDLLYFKYPEITLLDICLDETPAIPSDMHRSYTVCRQNEDHISEDEEEDLSRVSWKDLMQQTSSSYDAIIIRHGSTITQDAVYPLLTKNTSTTDGETVDTVDLADGKLLLCESLLHRVRSPETQHSPASTSARNTLLVHRRIQPPALEALQGHLRSKQMMVDAVELGKIESISPNSQIVIFFSSHDTDTGTPSPLHKAELQGLKILLGVRGRIICVTYGGLPEGKSPESAAVVGMMRAIRAENAAVDVRVLDFEPSASKSTFCEHVAAALASDSLENEVAVMGSTKLINRLQPISTALQQDHTLEDTAETNFFSTKLERNGATTKVAMIEYCPDELGAGYVEVQVKAMGITPYDKLAMDGTSDPEFFGLEYAGTVTKVGQGVQDLKPGDNVMGVGDRSFSSFQQGCNSSTAYTEAASVLWAYTGAHYVISELARLRTGERCLITFDTGIIGLAAIHLARLQGAEIFTLAHSLAEREILLADHGLEKEHIIQIEDLARLNELMFDFVLCSDHVLARHQDTFTMAPFGRLVNAQPGDSTTFSPSRLATTVSYSCFTVKDLICSRPSDWNRFTGEVAALYRSGRIEALKPLKAHTMKEIELVVRSNPSTLEDGKHVVTNVGDASGLHIRSIELAVTFPKDAAYLLVGCLGGLGRQLASWMISRGARRLIFLSRSGLDNTAAKQAIKDMESTGVSCTVVRGDVTCLEDVQSVCSLQDESMKIKGIVQSAMVLRDSLFENMTYEDWVACTGPKMQGTLNLHRVFNKELDFFLMLSSISATLGNPGQSNYASANCYLDYLAKHRRLMGLPASSLVLPMVLGSGYVSEHPEIEKSLSQHGLYGISVEEMLSGVELSLRHQTSGPDQIILGMDPERLRQAMERAGINDAYWTKDPRFSLVATEIAVRRGRKAAASFVKDSLAARIRSGMKTETKETGVAIAFTGIASRLSRLFRTAPENFRPERSLAYYGLDSVVGAEFRNWLYEELDVEISFQRLLDPNTALQELAEIACEAVS